MDDIKWSHTGGYSNTLFLTALIFPFVIFPIALMRFWTGKYVAKRWFLDDRLALVAFIFTVMHSIVCCLEARLGGGAHLVDMTPANLTLLLQVGRFAGVPLYNLATFFIKISILAFYLRFSWELSFRIVVYIVGFMVLAYSCVNVIGSLTLVCSNASKCKSIFTIFIACASMNVATDVAILVLPLWILHPMRLSVGRRLAISLLLMAGGFVIGVSIFRLIVMIRVKDDADATYAWGESVLWALIEVWAGFFCACVSSLKPLFTRAFSAFLSKISTTRNNNRSVV